MSVEIPSALIRRIQSSLSRSAGVPSSYDPADPSLPPLPSLQDAISALDADPSITSSYRRCGKCRRGAGLVRGAHSTLCIFCGRDRRLDGVEHSISFSSTAACKKLLESLQLDGSEVIDLETESYDSNKGQDKQLDGLVLSDILDLELKWPPKKEAFIRSSDKTPASVQAVNLSGVDLDSFFSDLNEKTVSGAPSVTSEESMPNKQTIGTESYVSSGSENFAVFKDLQTQDIGVSSANNRSGDEFSDSFADWEGGIQCASSPASHAESESESADHYHSFSTTGLVSSVTDVAVAAEPKPVDLFKDSTTEFSSHATPTSTFSEHAPMEHEIINKVDSREPTEEWDHFSSGAKWIQDDL